MTRSTPRLIKYLSLAALLVTVLFLVQCNRSLASLAEWIYAGSGTAVHTALAVLEAFALLWLWKGTFRRNRHLLVYADNSPEALHRFSTELVRRLQGNALVAGAVPRPVDASESARRAYIDACLAVLNNKADEEIRLTAKRIFLATALTQNGRLDALIMFVSLCRLVWRVSAIYNQRPHPREIFALYRTVACSTFLAFSLEELDITTEISVGFGESLHAALPAGATAGLPFAGKALQSFTAALIDGTANSYLALRAGIITRNAYAYTAREEQRPSRADVFRESGSILLNMSQELAEKIASALAAGLVGATRQAARYAGETTLQTGKHIVQGIGKAGQGVGASAEKLATGTAEVLQSTGSGLRKAGSATGTALLDTAGGIANGTASIVRQSGDGLLKAGSLTAETAAQAAGKTGEFLADTGSNILLTGGKAVRPLISALENGASATWRLLRRPFASPKK